MNDLIISSLLGVGLFVVIFYYNKNSNKKIIHNNEEGKDNKVDNNNDNNKENEETNEEKELKLKNNELLDKYLNESNDDDIVKKTQFLQKKFGVSEADIKNAIKQTRKDLNDKNSFNMDESISIWKIVDWIVYIILIVAACYFFNVSTKGDFGRVLAGMFPREFETLGLKKYIERV